MKTGNILILTGLAYLFFLSKKPASVGAIKDEQFGNKYEKQVYSKIVIFFERINKEFGDARISEKNGMVKLTYNEGKGNVKINIVGRPLVKKMLFDYFHKTKKGYSNIKRFETIEDEIKHLQNWAAA